jgi:tripartite-type tricarboxylate transporter receptor subunit TctC
MTNRPGGGSWQGFLDVKQARPDGYTLLVSSDARVCWEQWGVVTNKPVPVRIDEFVPIGLMNMSPIVFIVREDSPWKTLTDFVNACKAKPNEYIYGAFAYGSTHYPVLLLMDVAGIEARPVFYVGGGPVQNALLGGHIHFAAQFPSSVVPLIQGKKERALAVTAEKRWPSLPEVPTCREQGYDVVSGQGMGIFAHKKTPAAIVKKLMDVHQKVVADKKFIEMMENVGDFVNPMTPDEFNKYLERTTKVVYKVFQKEAAKTKK